MKVRKSLQNNYVMSVTTAPIQLVIIGLSAIIHIIKRFSQIISNDLGWKALNDNAETCTIDALGVLSESTSFV